MKMVIIKGKSINYVYYSLKLGYYTHCTKIFLKQFYVVDRIYDTDSNGTLIGTEYMKLTPKYPNYKNKFFSKGSLK